MRKKLTFDPELLYIGAMFHDMGLTKEYRSATERFEVDGAIPLATFCDSTESPRLPSTSSGTPLLCIPRRYSQHKEQKSP
jgi:hypothetical protein